jgi:hypothetical protein
MQEGGGIGMVMTEMAMGCDVILPLGCSLLGGKKHKEDSAILVTVGMEWNTYSRKEIPDNGTKYT